jgi:dTDP-4-amino-4,6-dideoxygalactose transaminase
MKVPFLDLKSQYQSLKSEIDAAIQNVCAESSFILGPEVEGFEKGFAAFNEVPYCVGLASGTDALRLAFEALGIGAGDEVIVPAHTFVATAIGILETGARPVLVDIDPATFLINMDLVEAALTPRTKAICPVHLYGRVCDMDSITRFAKRHDLAIVEDTAQAHGARWNGRRAGTFGDVGCFSFYPGKNLGAYGDGGAVVMSSETLYRQVRKLRNYGSEIKYQHPEKGMNSRLDSIQAAVLNVKLGHLKTWNEKRWSIAARYTELLTPFQSLGITLPDIRTKEEHVFHLYVVQVPHRDDVIKKMADKGVSTVVHYPVPFHLQGGYAHLGYKAGNFPVTESVCQRILSLPMFPEMTEAQIEYVCQTLVACVRAS